MSNDRQITGNIGLYHVARELSRVGWNVMPTVRNARGADLYAVSADEGVAHPVQVKAHSGAPQDTALGLHPERLVTPWWVIVTRVRDESPVCHLFALDEIRALMVRDPGTRSGKPEAERRFWLPRRLYTLDDPLEMVTAREAWGRLGDPGR
jgi:hypothetical protein